MTDDIWYFGEVVGKDCCYTAFSLRCTANQSCPVASKGWLIDHIRARDVTFPFTQRKICQYG
jgi:hypothetical protein